MENNPILRYLETAQARFVALTNQINTLNRERDIAKAQMDAYRIASEAIDGMKSVSSVSEKKKRNRLPSPDWMGVFRHLVLTLPEGFGYDEIESTAMASGVDVRRASLRTKMMNYVNDDVFERVNDGKFKVTAKGRSYFKIDEARPSDGIGAAEAAPKVGEQDATTFFSPLSPTPAWAQ